MSRSENEHDGRTTYSYYGTSSRPIHPDGGTSGWLTHYRPSGEGDTDDSPFDRLLTEVDGRWTLATISTEVGTLLARARPGPAEPAPQVSKDAIYASHVAHQMEWLATDDDWPLTVVVRIYEGENLLEMRTVPTPTLWRERPSPVEKPAPAQHREKWGRVETTTYDADGRMITMTTQPIRAGALAQRSPFSFLDLGLIPPDCTEVILRDQAGQIIEKQSISRPRGLSGPSADGEPARCADPPWATTLLSREPWPTTVTAQFFRGTELLEVRTITSG